MKNHYNIIKSITFVESHNIQTGELYYDMTKSCLYLGDKGQLIKLESLKPKEEYSLTITNCPNCGAPITSKVCEYCGTHFSKFQRS